MSYGPWTAMVIYGISTVGNGEAVVGQERRGSTKKRTRTNGKDKVGNQSHGEKRKKGEVG